MVFKIFYNVLPTGRDLTKPLEKSDNMFLQPCFMVIDRDGDFVDACSGKLPPSALDHVLQRVNAQYPENAPFRVVKWTGKEFVEMSAVS